MMKKWVAVLLMLVLALSLTGCQTDPAKEAAKVVAEVNGAKITKGEAESIYNQMMTETEYYYSMYGYSFDRADKTVIASIKSQTLTLMTENLALEQKAEALGRLFERVRLRHYRLRVRRVRRVYRLIRLCRTYDSEPTRPK